MQQFKRLDFVGLVLFTGGLCLFLIGLSWGSGTYPWADAHVIATIVVGFVSLVAFVLYGEYTVTSCFFTTKANTLRCICSQRRSTYANPSVSSISSTPRQRLIPGQLQVKRISCHGHHCYGWILCLLLHEHSLAITNCFSLFW